MKLPTDPDDELSGNDAELGPGSAGQSGDLQGIVNEDDYDPDGVRELLEEGQSFEASIISGIENAPPADEAEVTTKQVPEDDVPDEYLEGRESER